MARRFRSELTTVREMIDTAFIFDEDEPMVDFKLLESILFIIARQLNVLQRNVMIERAKIRKYKLKANTVAISELKVHQKIVRRRRDTTTTESTTEKSSSSKHRHERKLSRQRSRSKSRGGIDYKKHVRYREGRRTRDDIRDALHERILVISRASMEGIDERDHSAAVVTQMQYDKLLSEVRTLQDKFGIVPNIDTSWFNLHKPTSLTDPRAAVNMATRLDIVQKKLNQMIDIVSKFASAIPGFDINAAMDDNFLHQMYGQSSLKQTPVGKISSPKTEPEEVVLEEFLLEEENFATWTELNADLADIKKNVIDRFTTAADQTTETAKRASKLFKNAGPRLSLASILNVKFAKLRIKVDRFTSHATAFDVKMASQMGDCQESVSQMQFEVETMTERIEDVLAHPAEDPSAVAAIKDEFAILQGDLGDANRNQMELKRLHGASAVELEIIRQRLELICQMKLTREEALERLESKARVDEINSFLSRDQLYAVVRFLQKEINQTHGVIDNGELRWQHIIEDYMLYLYEKGDRVQVVSLQQSLRKSIKDVSTKVNVMLDIVGDFPVTMFKKKMNRDGNCLSCGTPAVLQVTEKNLKLAKRLMSRSRPIKPLVIEEKETEKPCFPGRPIPHPLDPRALVCDRYCGASISKSEDSLNSCMGLEVIDKNPAHKSGMQRVNLTCTPCTHSEETFFK